MATATVTPNIDLSAGLVPIPAPTKGIDLSAGLVPKGAPQPGAPAPVAGLVAPQPPAQAAPAPNPGSVPTAKSPVSKVWDWMNTPVNVGHLRESIQQGDDQLKKGPTLEEAAHPITTMIKTGITGFGTDAAKMLLTPLSIALAGAGSIAKGASAASQLARAGMVATGLGFGASAITDAVKNGVVPNAEMGEKGYDDPEYLRRVLTDAAMATGAGAEAGEIAHGVRGRLTHPAGKVTGIDHETGLPIVDRTQPSEHAPVEGEAKPILHDSNDVETLRASAERQAPKIGDAAAAAAEGVPGAQVEAVRDSKDSDRIADKAERQGVGPNQIADIAAAKITVPDQAAADKVLDKLHEQMPVESVSGSVTGEPGKNAVRQVQAVVNTNSEGEPLKRAEVLIQTPEMHEATDGTHDDYRKAQELRADGKTAEADALDAKIRAEHEAAEQAAQTRLQPGAAVNQNEGKGGRGESPEPAAGAKAETAPAGETKYEFGSTQTNIPEDSEAHNILSAARDRVDDADLAGKGKDVGGNHVTVRYGIQGGDTAAIERYLRSQAPFEAKLGDITNFPPTKNSDGAAVLKADIESPELHRMNAEIEQHGNFKKTDFPDYKPHATIAYVKPEAVDKYTGGDTAGKTFPVRSVAISDRDGNLKEIPLEGSDAGRRNDDVAQRPSQEVAPGRAEQGQEARAPRPQAVAEQKEPRAPAPLRGGPGEGGGGADAARPVDLTPRAPKPLEPKETFKAGSQATPVKVRVDGRWQPATLDYYPPSAPEATRRGRVTLANGEKIKNVKDADMKLAGEPPVEGVTAGVEGHEKPKHGAIAVDMDNTIAHYDGYKGATVIGKPIESEVARVKQMLADGKDVWIYTARAKDAEAIPAIKAWAKEHIGKELPITNVKYPEFAQFIDDRAVLPAHMEAGDGTNDSARAGRDSDRPEDRKTSDAANVPGDRHRGSKEDVSDAQPEAGGDDQRPKAPAPVRRPDRSEAERHVDRPTKPASGNTIREASEGPSAGGGDRARDAGGPDDRTSVGSTEDKANATRADERKSKLDAAAARTQRENAAQHKSTVETIAGHKMLVLDPDGEGVWHRLFSKVKDVDGRNPLGAKASWKGMTIDKTGVNTALAYLHAATGDVDAMGAPDGGAKAGYERMIKLLKDARNEQGGAVILRGDYRADTAREEATHQWQREHGLDKSYAMRSIADEPEFQEIATQLRGMGYDDARPGEIASEMMAKAMAGDPEFHLTDEQRERLVRSFLTEAVEEKGPEILKGLPETDARVKDVVDEVRRGYDHGEQYDQRDEGSGGQAPRGSDGQGGGETGQADERPRSLLGDGEGRRDAEGGEQRVQESGPAKGELKAPERHIELDPSTGSKEPVFQRSKATEESGEEAPDWLREAQGRGEWDPRDRPGARERPTQQLLPFGGKPVWQRALGAFKNWRDDVQDAGDDQRALMRDTRGQMDREVLQLKKSLEDVRKDFVGMKREDVTSFIDHVESGNADKLEPKYRDIATGLHMMLERDRLQLNALDPEKLKNFYENYFPHIWDRSGKVARMMQAQSGSQPLHGSGSFLQHRTLYPATFKEGIKIGLEPKTWNPVDMALMKHAEIQRYIFGLQTVQNMKAQGLTKMFKSAKDAPANWVQLDDRFATVTRTNEAGERVMVGHYYAPAEAAKSFNNFVSRGLQGRYRAVDTGFALNNMMNSLQLGLSAFHATASVLHTAVSDVALGLQDLTQGKVGDAAKHVARGIAPGASALRALHVGNQMMHEYLDPGSASKYEAEANWVARAGGRPEQSLDLQPARWRQMAEDIRQGNWVRGAKGALPSAIDAAGGWLMHGMIPRIKLGTFQDMASNILKEAHSPNTEGDGSTIQTMSDEKIRQKMQEAWDSVDNRYGQMIYDNLFWNKSALDAARLGIRSVGWNLGSAREFGGGVSDALRTFARAASMKKPEVGPRLGFTLALPIYTAMASSAMTYLMTGHGPDTQKNGLKAYFFPEKADGTLMSIPGYMKDVFAFVHDPIGTVEHKVSPLINSMVAMWQNQDYYGNEIRNEDDPLIHQAVDQAKYLGKQFVPFSIESMQQQRKNAGGGELSDIGKKDSGVMGLLGYAGFQPATKAVQNSAAVNLAEHYRQETPEAPKTAEQAAHSQIRRNLVKALETGNLNDEKLNAALDAGKITNREYRAAQREAMETPLERISSGLSLPQLLQVWKKANPDERAALQEVIQKKAIAAYKNDPDSVTPLEAQLNAALAENHP